MKELQQLNYLCKWQRNILEYVVMGCNTNLLRKLVENIYRKLYQYNYH